MKPAPRSNLAAVFVQMANDLEATEWLDSYIENYDIEEEEFKDLVRMFRLHADAGHYLESSW